MASSASTSATEPPPFAILPWKFHPPGNLLPTKVSQKEEHNYYGTFSVDRVARFAATSISLGTDASYNGIKEVMNGFIAIAGQDITRRVRPAQKPYITEAVWLNIRMRHASTEWKTPNWHRDFVPFECRCAPEGNVDRTHTKYIFALLGPHLEVCKPSFQADFAFESVAFIKNLSPEARRKLLGERMRNMDKEKIQPRQYIQLGMGKWARSPIYTEPDITNSESIFVSVMFGSAAEISDMCMLKGLCFREGQENCPRSPPVVLLSEGNMINTTKLSFPATANLVNQTGPGNSLNITDQTGRIATTDEMNLTNRPSFTDQLNKTTEASSMNPTDQPSFKGQLNEATETSSINPMDPLGLMNGMDQLDRDGWTKSER